MEGLKKQLAAQAMAERPVQGGGGEGNGQGGGKRERVGGEREKRQEVWDRAVVCIAVYVHVHVCMV